MTNSITIANDAILKYETKYPIHSAIRTGNQDFAIKAISNAISAGLSLETTETQADLIAGVADYYEENTASQDMTPLLVATHYNLDKVVDFLITSGANVDAKSDQSAIYIAVSNNSKNLVLKLIAAGANVNSTFEGEESTPLHFAAAYGFNEIVKILLDAGADIKHRDFQGTTAFIDACMQNEFEAMQLCYSNNGVFLTDDLDNALAKMSKHNNKEAIEWLIAQGAEISTIE